MRRFLAHVLVDTIAISLTLAVLSAIRIPQAGIPDGVPMLEITLGDPDAFTFDIEIGPFRSDLFIGFLFALSAVVMPPILAAFFGRWYLRNPILAYVLANAALFIVVAQISAWIGTPFRVPEPALLWLFIDSMVFTLVTVALDAVLGLDRPLMEEKAQHTRFWRLLEGMPSARRNMIIENVRLYEVYDKISRFGLEIAAGRTPFLSRLRRVGNRLSGTSSASFEALSTPAKVRVMLQQLGPTYVKLGQMLAGRRELLPKVWCDELAQLQSAVPPFPWETAKSIMTAELGRPPEEVFASIEEKPLGAASLAQVHRATLKDGRQVVVKVQRPQIQAKVRADLGVMQELAEVAEQRFATARRIGVVNVIREFADGVREELDYSIEAYNAMRLADVLKDIKGVSVPAIETELSTKRVIVMGFVPGVKATQADRLDPSVDREQVARTLVRSLIKQMLLEGFFHGDPHPGNLLLDPATGNVTFLDLGLMGELPQEDRFDLLALIWALKSNDPGMLATVARRLCRPTGPVDEASFHAAVERLFSRTWTYGHGSLGEVVTALFDTLGRENLQMKRELVMAIKAVSQAEELVSAIAPGLPLVQVLVEEAQGLLRDELTSRADRLLQGDLAGAVKEVATQAPALGLRFIPQLISVAATVRASLAAETDAERLADALERSVDGLADRVDGQLSRLSQAVALAGVGLTAGLAALAFVGQPADAGGEEIIIIAIPALLALGIALEIRRWRQRDAAALAERERKRFA